MKVDYSKQITPEEYKCSNCSVSGIKLWREYQTIQPRLLCANCAASEQGIDISDIDSKGMRMSNLGPTDQIGWYVPAVPDEEELGYWGYTSVPDAGVKWWRGLVTKKE